MKNKYFGSLVFILMFAFFFAANAQRPSIYFEPNALEATIGPNETAQVHSVLHNNSDYTVEFSFPGYITRDLGGPDAYGYTWIDSDEPGGPDWAWTDISESGIPVEGLGDDLVAGPYEMDINFKFYGETRTQFWISSNGVISFNNQIMPYSNGAIPTNNNYIDFVAWFWDDLTIDTNLTSVYFKNFEEKTVVQFNKMVHYPGTESFITAQVIFVNNGTIFIRYKQISESFEINSATVGLQSWNPEMGLQVLYNAEYLHPELAIRFDLNRNFITTVNPNTLTLPPDTQETIWITYSSEGFEQGNYEQDLKCVTSHPELPYLMLHNVMHVTGAENAGFKGYVTDAATGFAINEVMVKVGEQYTYTNDNGYYELPLEEGVYNVKFMRSGYQTLIVEDTAALPGFSILDVELEGFYFLAGQVFAGENHIETGFAYLYKMLEGTVVDINAEMVGEMGWFEFSGLASAGYIIKAEPSPNSMYYGDYLPTYYGDVMHWEEATLLEVPPSTEAAHIHLIPLVSAPTGLCQISGSVINDERMGDVPVILRTTDHEQVMMTNSAADGTYSFTNLAYGSYELFAEIAGKSITPAVIELSETQSALEGIDMVVLENEIIITLDIAESEIFESVPVIYPNPADESARLQLNLKKASVINVSIYDQAGKMISLVNFDADGLEVFTIDLSQMDKGIYFMKIVSEGEQIIKRLIKL